MRLKEYLLNTKRIFLFRAILLFWYKRLRVKLEFSIPLNVYDSALIIIQYGLLVVNPEVRIRGSYSVHFGG